MLAPSRRSSSTVTPLTVAWVPTGMKAGVCTTPCGVATSPERAAPSVAIRRNENGSGTLYPPSWPGLSRPSTFWVDQVVKAWMPGTRPGMTWLVLSSKQQTRIAIGVEPIARLDGVRIGPFHGVEAAERGDQHEQRRA